MGGIKFFACGDKALSVVIGEEIDVSINRRVHLLKRALEIRSVPGIFALVPSYRALLIQYDPLLCSFERLMVEVEKVFENLGDETTDEKVLEVPVCYDRDFGLDIEEVAYLNGLKVEDVIEIHTSSIYQVFMLGFTPGFCYLGKLDPRLWTPRKKEPRKKVPPGSVGIADKQTGIYSIESPGGWQIIGRTPLRLFDPERNPPFLLKAGNRVRFRAIGRKEFESFSG